MQKMHTSRLLGKLHSFPPDTLHTLEVPMVDAQVAALSLHTVILSEGEGVPTDTCDKIPGMALKRALETSSSDLRLPWVTSGLSLQSFQVKRQCRVSLFLSLTDY